MENVKKTIQLQNNYNTIIFYATINGIPEGISEITDIFNKIKLNNLNSNFRGIEII